ncbi:hypothetical protein FXO37_35500 [Capsicum annuum]|nr:hypothetical protein FXO37_35500 [Capsicum annuum]
MVGDNNRVIVLLPIVVQTNESQMVIPQKEFPNKVLHDIISHNKDEKELVEIEIPKQQVEAPMEGGDTENAMLHITRSNLSPRVMEAARKDEKIGGLFMVDDDHEDFECCISSCNLTEVPYKGSPFTWWNGSADNDFILRDLEEVKKVVLALNGDSASGPNGLKGRFYQCCWDIIGNDILTMA